MGNEGRNIPLTSILTIQGIYVGNSNLEMQFFQLFMEDTQGNPFITTVACKHIYVDGLMKSFRRLTFIPAPQPVKIVDEPVEKTEEVSGGNGSDSSSS